jgi:hypothetical protein
MTQPWPALLYALALATSAPASSPADAPDHTCSWTFLGGSPASSSSCVPPQVTFSTPGPKKVTLKVCTSSCSSITKTVLVANPRPAIVKITPSKTTLYPGDSVTLTASVQGRQPLITSWTLPGNRTASTNPVTVTVPTSSTRILLEVSNSAGTARSSIYLPVLNPRPRGSIQLAPPTPYLGDRVTASAQVTGRPPLAYRWTLQPDGLSSTSETFVWDSSPAKPGLRRLELSLSNASGSVKLSRIFRLDPPPLAISFAPVCPSLCFFSPGQPVQFALALHPSAEPTKYEYDWHGDGSFEVVSPVPIQSYAYLKTGSFRPRMRLSAPGGRTLTLLSTRILVVSNPR